MKRKLWKRKESKKRKRRKRLKKIKLQKTRLQKNMKLPLRNQSQFKKLGWKGWKFALETLVKLKSMTLRWIWLSKHKNLSRVWEEMDLLLFILHKRAKKIYWQVWVQTSGRPWKKRFKPSQTLWDLKILILIITNSKP